MKKALILSSLIMGVSLGACQQTVNDAEIKALRTDVDALKTEVFGNPLATCESINILSGPSAYQSTLKDLPNADQDADAWHLANGARKDVVTTPSGLQYSIVKKGDPKAPSPVGDQLVTVNYHGFFTNGEKFDSSYERGSPIDFPANGVIKGWVEALADMKPCEARTLYIPGNLAYGAKGRGNIPPNATLLFHVQLLKVHKK